MLTSGLVSVTFRKFSREKVIDVMKKAALPLIEWGGDVHVPFGEAEAVKEAAELCRTHGIATVSYGSYYRSDGDEVLRTGDIRCAASLSAPNIRIWAGKKGSGDASEADRAAVCENIRTACDAAAPFGMTVSVEFHGGTLTDEYESAVRLYHAVERDNFRLYWQPNQFRNEAYNMAALRAVLPYLSNVHVFTWEGHNRYPLADGARLWRKYIDLIASDGKDHGMLLEFVCDDTEDQLYRDAETLHKWGIN